MAVQAQYPSNVLLLNRNVQEGQDYSLQPGGIFLDQSSHALLNNGGTTNHQRKRGRETCPDNNVAGSTSSMNVYSVSMQPHHHHHQQQQTTQLIDLSQLHNNSVSTGLRLAFTDQQNHHHHHQQHQQQQHQQQQQHKVVDNSSAILSLFKEDLTTHVRQQREEIDQFLQAQGEQLRRTLAEKRQRLYRALLGAAEESLARRLREKEAEVERARRRNADLQARAAQLGAEAQIWQARARSQEAEAASLRAHIQQAAMGVGGGASDGCPAALEGAAEDAESVYADPERSSPEPSCKACRRRAATVLMLPCRHVSVCTDCERVSHTCPLCSCPRSSCIEIYLP